MTLERICGYFTEFSCASHGSHDLKSLIVDLVQVVGLLVLEAESRSNHGKNGVARALILKKTIFIRQRVESKALL
jgi:hypothetical protein